MMYKSVGRNPSLYSQNYSQIPLVTLRLGTLTLIRGPQIAQFPSIHRPEVGLEKVMQGNSYSHRNQTNPDGTMLKQTCVCVFYSHKAQ